MTDYSLVKDELMTALHCDAFQLEEYESYIKNAVASVQSILKNTEDENDIRVVHLCAMQVYYQIVLTEDAGDAITSFKAGDVSYTKDASSVVRAKNLLDLAMSNCSDLVKNNGFAFKAV